MILGLMLGTLFAMQDFDQIATKVDRPNKPQLLIVGFYHFENPGLDVVKADLDDHTSAKRQQEILQLNAQLARFKPTKVAIEHPATSDKAQAKYDNWKSGSGQLSASETEQVGFRLAKELGHDRIYPVDYKLDLDFEAVMGAADEPAMKEFQSMIGMVQSFMSTLKDRPVRDNLALLNSPSADRMGNGFYLRMLSVGAGQNHPGAKLASDWYARNLYWLANLAKIAQPKDRILVICGSGHASLLRSILRDSIDFEVVDPMPYLKGS